MKKKLLAGALSVAMLFGAATALPEDFSKDLGIEIGADAAGSSDYYFISNELSDGTLEITGYMGTDSELTVPSKLNKKTVTRIADGAFQKASGITSVTIPSTVTSIGEKAFKECKDLKSVTLSKGLTSIGNSAFESCSSLSDITLPSSVKSIGSAAFGYCYALESISIPEGVKVLEQNTFYCCSKLTSVSLPKSVTEISDYCFVNTGLKSLKIPAGLKKIGSHSFINNISLTSITVDSGNSSFSSSDGILFNKDKTEVLLCPMSKTSATIPSSVKSIGTAAFYGCTKLTSIKIPDKVTSIGEVAFCGCTSLKSAVIGSSVKSIGYAAFSSCYALASVNLPDTVTSIEEGAFYGCTNLKSFTIPKKVSKIGDRAIGYHEDEETWDDVIISGFKIKCYAGTAGEKYAKDNKISYSLLMDVSIPYSSYTYTGSAIKPEVTVKVGSKTLKNGTDYTVAYSNNTKVGIATIKVTGKGSYSGTETKTFVIKPKPGTLTLTTQNGAFKAAWTKDTSASGYEIVYSKNKDFKTSYTYNVSKNDTTSANFSSKPKAGETWYVKYRAYLSANGTKYGNYSGVKSIAVKGNLKSASIPYSSYTYTGSAIKPAVTVKDTKGNKLTTSDYSVSYSNNTKVGTATMKITGKGKYQGTLTKTFVIKPKPGTLTLTTTKGAFKASWTKNTSASGYEVLYSKDKNFKSGTVTTYTVSKNSTTSVNFSSKPNSGETWYVKYRAYVTVNGTKYGNYSSVKSIKVK